MATLLLLLALSAQLEAQSEVIRFDTPSKDGVVIHGQADLPNAHPLGAVILTAGTGTHDRDMLYGRSGSPRDKVFKDLAERLERRGLAAVRYDKRGVVFGTPPPSATDKVINLPASASRDTKLSAAVTTATQDEDLRAVYDWTRSKAGLGAACVVIFAHSEGMANTAEMAAQGAPAPRLVIGMGGLAESKRAALRWQMAERDVFALREMDLNHDGVTTNAEIQADWRQTLLGDLDSPKSLLSPNGQWTKTDLDARLRKESAAYEAARAEAMGVPDTDPWPDRASPAASFQWWKSWFIDDTPIAEKLSAWRTRFVFHYGGIDSQTNAQRQTEAIQRYLPASEVTIVVHPGRGHSLGPHPALGPIDEEIADDIADEALVACAQRAGGP